MGLLRPEIKPKLHVLHVISKGCVGPTPYGHEGSALRLMGALLAEIHEEWQGRCYLDMDVFHEWVVEQDITPEEAVVQIR